MKQAAVMLILNDDGLILGVSRRNDKTKFGLPGGKSNKNEAPKETALRETLEETGIKVKACTQIFKREEPPEVKGGKTFIVYCFYALQWEGKPQSSEEGKIEWLTSKELTTADKGAFSEYNKLTIAAFKKHFPDIKIQ
jgi:8-oxo-dGTP pyrophosphatase MutT (NUDIX family)